MNFLTNLIFAFLFGWLALWIAGRAKVPEPAAWIIALFVALLVYFANLAGQLIR